MLSPGGAKHSSNSTKQSSEDSARLILRLDVQDLQATPPLIRQKPCTFSYNEKPGHKDSCSTFTADYWFTSRDDTSAKQLLFTEAGISTFSREWDGLRYVYHLCAPIPSKSALLCCPLLCLHQHTRSQELWQPNTCSGTQDRRVHRAQKETYNQQIIKSDKIILGFSNWVLKRSPTHIDQYSTTPSGTRPACPQCIIIRISEIIQMQMYKYHKQLLLQPEKRAGVDKPHPVLI